MAFRNLFSSSESYVVEQKKLPTRPRIERQLAVVRSPYDPNQYFDDENPDKVYRRDGNFRTYTEMLDDYKIRPLTEIRSQLIFGSGWGIKPPVDEDGDEMEGMEEITKFIELNLKEWVTGNFTDQLKRITDAFYYGFDVSELLFTTKEWNGKTWIILDRLKQIPPDSIRFNIDDFGDLKPDGFIQYTRKGTEILEPKKFVISVWNPRSGNPYGQSDLRPCFIPWFTKKEVQKMWPMYLERFGMPLILGKYSNDISPDETDEIMDILKSVQSGFAAVVPEDLDIELKEMDQKGADSYESALEKLDNQISAALLIPDLLGFGSSTNTNGSFALGKEQKDTFLKIIDGYRGFLEETVVFEQIIKKLVDLNFAGVERYPRLEFNPIEEEDQRDNTKIFIDLIKTDKVQATEEDINHIKDVLGFPASAEDVLIEPEKPVDTKALEESKKPVEDVGEDIDDEDVGEDEFAAEEKMVFGDQFVDFQKIDEDFNENTDNCVLKISKLINESKLALMEDLNNRKLLEKNKLKQIALIKIPFPTGKIKTQLERCFAKASAQGFRDFKSEVNVQFNEFGLIDHPELDLAGAKAFLTAYNESKSFQVAGDMEDVLRREVRVVLLEGIKTGSSTSDIMASIDVLFSPYIVGNAIASAEITPFRLETIVRTNANTFYNQARIAGFHEAVAAGIVTHFRYSAILDNRTSDICNELHNTVLPATDGEALSLIQPPRHFNCRSILVPIASVSQPEMQKAVERGELTAELKKSPDFYDGFTSKSGQTRKKP